MKVNVFRPLDYKYLCDCVYLLMRIFNIVPLLSPFIILIITINFIIKCYMMIVLQEESRDTVRKTDCIEATSKAHRWGWSFQFHFCFEAELQLPFNHFILRHHHSRFQYTQPDIIPEVHNSQPIATGRNEIPVNFSHPQSFSQL